MSSITVFSNESSVISYNDAKGRALAISAEGAIIKGGKALMGLLKDAALDSAHRKAESGKYRAAADVLSAAFPAVGKAAEKLLGTVWANKSTMGTLISAVLRVEAGSKGFNEKQLRARALAKGLLGLPAFAAVVDSGDVVEA